MIIGLLGTVQTGKSELAPAFQKEGFTVVNLNHVGNALRAAGTETRAFLDTLLPEGTLYDDGIRKTAYYPFMAKHPDIFELVMAMELVAVMKQLTEVLRARKHERLVISWEYLHKVFPLLDGHLDHLLYFDPTSNLELWGTRLISRALERVWDGPPPEVQAIEELVKAAGMHWVQLEPFIKTRLHIRVNTAQPDWGAAALVDLLRKLN